MRTVARAFEGNTREWKSSPKRELPNPAAADALSCRRSSPEGQRPAPGGGTPAGRLEASRPRGELTRLQSHPQHHLAPVVEGEEAANQEALRLFVAIGEEPVSEVILLLPTLSTRRRSSLPVLHCRPLLPPLLTATVPDNGAKGAAPSAPISGPASSHVMWGRGQAASGAADRERKWGVFARACAICCRGAVGERCSLGGDRAVLRQAVQVRLRRAAEWWRAGMGWAGSLFEYVGGVVAAPACFRVVGAYSSPGRVSWAPAWGWAGGEREGRVGGIRCRFPEEVWIWRRAAEPRAALLTGLLLKRAALSARC